MKKAAIAAAVVSLAFAGTVFAAEPQPAPGPNFDQRKADMLKMLDERAASIQAAKACVEATKTPDELKACREKHREEMKKMRGMGGPGGPK